MEPGTAVTLALAGMALIGGIIANLRVRSSCHTQNFDLSVSKQFNKDLGNVLRDIDSTDASHGSEDNSEETDL